MPEKGELPSSPPPDAVGENPQNPRQSLVQKAVSLLKGVLGDIGSGRAREQLSPFPPTPTALPQEELPQPKVAEPSKP